MPTLPLYFQPLPVEVLPRFPVALATMGMVLDPFVTRPNGWGYLREQLRYGAPFGGDYQLEDCQSNDPIATIDTSQFTIDIPDGQVSSFAFEGTLTYPDSWEGVFGVFAKPGFVSHLYAGDVASYSVQVFSPRVRFTRARNIPSGIEVEVLASPSWELFSGSGDPSQYTFLYPVSNIVEMTLWLGESAQTLTIAPVTLPDLLPGIDRTRSYIGGGYAEALDRNYPGSDTSHYSRFRGLGATSTFVIPHSHVGPVLVQAKNSLGQTSVKQRLHLGPVAKGSITPTSETNLTVSDSSFDYDGSIASGKTVFYYCPQELNEADLKWLKQVNFYTPYRNLIYPYLLKFNEPRWGTGLSDALLELQGPVEIANGQFSADDVGSLHQTLSEGFIYVFRQVWDDGLNASYPAHLGTFKLPQSEGGFGLTFDNSGTLFLAVASSGGVQLYSTTGALAQKKTLALVANTRGPSIWKDAHQRLWLHAQKNKSEWRLWYSDTNGRTFQESNMSWNPELYSHGDAIGLRGGGIATLAVEISTKKLWFKTSVNEGATWTTPVLIATLTKAQQFRLRQKTEARSTEIIATNSIDKQFLSENQGRTWPPN